MESVSRVASFIILLTLTAQISSQIPPSVAQYLQLSGLGLSSQSLPNPGLQGYSSSAYPLKYQSSSHPPSYINSNYPLSKSSVVSSPLPLPLSAIANLAANIPISPAKLPSIPKANLPCSDTSVLNNLAIALQLLIVNNILSTPPIDAIEPLSNFDIPKLTSIPKYESVPISPLALSIPIQALQSVPYVEAPRVISSSYDPLPYIESPKPLYASYESLPNSNFLSSSGFAEPPMFGSAIPVRTTPRTSMSLMSPYEALGPSLVFSDSVLSSAYSPNYSKNNLKSPYATIFDGQRDLFTVADLL